MSGIVYDEHSVIHDRFQWARLRAFVTGLVNQELLLRNEYLAAENRVLRAHLPSRLRLSDPERSTLAEIAKRLGRQALRDITYVAKPDTILGCYRRLVAQKFDGSRQRGVTRTLVLDNLREGVLTPDIYDPRSIRCIATCFIITESSRCRAECAIPIAKAKSNRCRPRQENSAQGAAL
jgi:hypothetical protein